MKRFERLKAMPLNAFAQAVVFDSEGFERSVCGICKRYEEGDCDDNCYQGVVDYLESEEL